MAHGKTLDMIKISKDAIWLRPRRGKVDRDRSLAGKDRIRARKAARTTA